MFDCIGENRHGVVVVQVELADHIYQYGARRRGRMVDLLSNVSVHKQIAWFATSDNGFGHSRISTSDPEDL